MRHVYLLQKHASLARALPALRLKRKASVLCNMSVWYDVRNLKPCHETARTRMLPDTKTEYLMGRVSDVHLSILVALLLLVTYWLTC